MALVKEREPDADDDTAEPKGKRRRNTPDDTRRKLDAE
jgi:hypothetical protein